MHNGHMNKLSRKERAQIIRSLVEGNSIRGTVRITGFAKNTVTKLLVSVGGACDDYQDRVFRDLTCKTLQADEIWSYCYAREKNVPAEKRGEFGYGDVWTFTAIDADTKLVPAWMIGSRTPETAHLFMKDLAARLATRVQLTTDGHKMYVNAVEAGFGGDVDFAQFVKIYGTPRDELGLSRGSMEVIGTVAKIVSGDPDEGKINTSFVERQNLTMRMGMRRFVRQTNGYSKKIENMAAAIALHYLYYNFARPHMSLGKNTTPAMAAGVADHVWTCEEIAALLD